MTDQKTAIVSFKPLSPPIREIYYDGEKLSRNFIKFGAKFFS